VKRILVVAFVTSSWSFAQQAPPSYKAADPPNRNLDGSLYMQTAAEYRAACYQAYNLATERLKIVAGKPGKFAVITDLDETVIDNSGFMAMQLRSGLAYDQRLWDDWEQNHPDKLALVPGASEFIHEAAQQHVAVFYISNRNNKFRTQTKYALGTLLGLSIGDDFLKLKTDTSDKTARFHEVTAAGYTVLLYLGDNLRDFDNNLKFRLLVNDTDSELEGAIKDRKAAIDKDRPKMGMEWIILPNSSYGEWSQVALDRGRRDLDRLVPEAKASSLMPVSPLQSPLPKACIVNQKGAFVLGYLVSAIGGAVLLGVLIVVAAPKEPTGGKYSALLVLAGIADSLMYATLFIVGQPLLIVPWLAFKLAVYWKGWRSQEQQDVNIFLIANAISLMIAYLGAWLALERMPLS
jgi:5'-nucleotidase (lipoprotein e(P4) family)